MKVVTLRGLGLALATATLLQLGGVSAHAEELQVTIDNFTFTSAGDYKFFCSLHPHMTGMIKVE